LKDGHEFLHVGIFEARFARTSSDERSCAHAGMSADVRSGAYFELKSGHHGTSEKYPQAEVANF
jgi:hypothetical protein